MTSRATFMPDSKLARRRDDSLNQKQPVTNVKGKRPACDPYNVN